VERSEQQSWEMLYNEEQRSILKNAQAALIHAGMKQKGTPNPAIAALRKATYHGKKDFPAIKKRTENLEKTKGIPENKKSENQEQIHE